MVFSAMEGQSYKKIRHNYIFFLEKNWGQTQSRKQNASLVHSSLSNKDSQSNIE